MPTCFSSNLTAYSSTIITSLLSKNNYTITGVAPSPTLPPPPFTSQSVPPSDRKTRSHLLSSADCILLILDDLSSDLSVEDDILSTLKFTPLTSPKNLIVISSISTWANTLTSPSNPLTSSSYLTRLPLLSSLPLKRLEDISLTLSSPLLSVNVLCPGILYGHGEDNLYYSFRDAWLHQKIPLLVPTLTDNKGVNLLPTFSVTDLSNVVLTILKTDSKSLEPVMLLVDPMQSSLSEIIECISENLNATKEVRYMSESSRSNILLEHPKFKLLNVHLNVSKDACSLPLRQKGILEEMERVCEEFVKCRGLEAMRILITSPFGNDLTSVTEELKGRYSLPVLSRKTTVEIVMKGEEGSSKVRDEVVKVWESEECGKDVEKIPDKLIAECFRFCLDSGTCKQHGYVMYDFPETENDAYVMFSDTPPPNEEEEPPSEEPVDDKKKKAPEKKGKGKNEAPPTDPIKPIVKFPLNPKKGPTHVLTFPASDSYLFGVNGAVPVVEEEGSEPAVSEAGQKYRERLAAYRAKVSKFGERPPPAPEEESEEKKEGGEETTEEKAPEAPETIFKSLPEWLEDKFGCKLASFPCDEKCAEELSLPVLDETQKTSYITEFIEEGCVPGIVYMNAKPPPKAKGDAPDVTPPPTTSSLDAASVPEPSSATPPSASEDDVLPHVKVYNDVAIEEAEEVQFFIDEYKNYCTNNIMKQVTLGMMKILKMKDDPDVDVVDTLADFLIAEGKKLEKEGEEKARTQFDAVLKHVEEMSSRLIDGRDDSTIAGTVFSNFSSKV
ncbi:hypothetical protein TrST_g8008 [Triparma strigata]|uniref:Uncharacterized protein n=1 Tax=Triparma strigata TaxID=1606541 RepID=A0A9W7E528_9STRA|nr:hypothetical protein TrST_g8008 [Triparma strigata]